MCQTFLQLKKDNRKCFYSPEILCVQRGCFWIKLIELDAYLVEPGQGRDQVGPFCGDLKTFQSPLHRCRVLLVLGLCSEVPISLGMILCSHCHTRSPSHGHTIGTGWVALVRITNPAHFS